MSMDVRPGNQIKPLAPEPEYAKIEVPVVNHEWHGPKGSGASTFVRMMVCTRCGSYVWDLQAHENWHQQ